MQPNWTAEQQEAITARGQNLLVSAGAGSGKTAVLVERIIRRVLDEKNPVDINRLLVVTFTNAAASEMRQRIGSALFQRLKETEDASLAQYLQKQLSLLNIASITTLHSFCLDLLREHYLLVGLPAKFTIANEAEKTLLMEEVLDELLETAYQEKEPAFLELIEAYGGREDELVRKIILELYQFSLSQPKPVQWLDTLGRQYELTSEAAFATSPWMTFLRQQCVTELGEAIGFLETAMEIATKPEGPESYLSQLEAERDMLLQVCQLMQEPLSDGAQAFATVTFATLRAKGKPDIVLKEQAKGYRDKAKAIALHWKNDIFLRSHQENLQQIQNLAGVVGAFVGLARAFYERLQAAKQKKALVDFSDLEHFVLLLLEEEGNGIASSLKEKFAEVLVDEYQDINCAQEAILQMVSRENNRFFVGDVKQSIYRFRLAEPGLFLSKYLAYSQGNGGRKIDLAANFRSQGEILKGINFVFAQLMHSGVTEIDYDEEAYLIPRRTDTHPYPIELDIIDVKQAKEEEAEDTSTAQREARLVGKKILALVAEGYAYSDMVILLRSTKTWAGIFQEEFQLLGIPCFAEVTDGSEEAPEILLISSILQIIDNPYQDIPLAGVLLSVFGGFTPDDLTTIRIGEKGPLYDGLLVACEKEIAQPLKDKISAFLTKLAELRYIAMQQPVSELLMKIYQEYHLFQWVGLLPGGAARQANLNAFYQQAKEYDGQSYGGLYRFVLFLERMSQSGNRFIISPSSGNGEVAVRIMSIHHSKGLEFPIVFVCGLGRKFNMQDTIGDVLLHRDLGMGIVAIDKRNHVKYQTLPKVAIMEKARQETLGEELRVLYVALTRARDRLFLVGSCTNLEKSIQNWADGCDVPGFTLAFDHIRNSRSPLDWLARAVIRHRDGAPLRKQIELPPMDMPREVYEHDSSWQVQILHAAGAGTLAAEVDTAFLDCLDKQQPVQEAPQQREIQALLDWQYPWPELAEKEAKLSVTEMEQKRKQKEASFSSLEVEPVFAESTDETSVSPLHQEGSDKVDPRVRGTMHHFIFEHLILSPNLSVSAIHQQIDEMLSSGLLPQELARQINYQGIYDFFTQEIGQELLQSSRVYRELSFLTVIPATEIYADVPTGEEMVLQGTIDLAFLSSSGWVIIDYKSGAGDYHLSDTEIAHKYGGQVKQYARAFARISGEPVERIYIYLLQQGKFIEIH
ncbi:MAG: helicase-exonuclease AddAB subunit AddA [Peptococcaceae bacterium]|nr:helicase-exonuclease AddAB subunit AddA [Peptococcaceae bacterium]